MLEKTIGDILREARLAKKYHLEDIESETALNSHYLLALELNQTNLIPEDEVEKCLVEYGQFLELDTEELLNSYHTYQEQKEEAPIAVTKASQPSSQETKIFDKPIKTVETSISRSNRYKEDKKNKDYFPILLLSSVAIIILLFVGFVTWNQMKNDSQVTTTVAESSSSSITNETQEETTSESSDESSDETLLKLTTEGSGTSLTTTVTNVTDDLEVVISLSGADSSWVSVTNAESGDTGVLLSSDDTTSYTATLPYGTTSSLITLGVSEGVTVTIDGQEIDMSGLTTTKLGYITLTIE